MTPALLTSPSSRPTAPGRPDQRGGGVGVADVAVTYTASGSSAATRSPASTDEAELTTMPGAQRRAAGRRLRRCRSRSGDDDGLVGEVHGDALLVRGVRRTYPAGDIPDAARPGGQRWCWRPMVGASGTPTAPRSSEAAPDERHNHVGFRLRYRPGVLVNHLVLLVLHLDLAADHGVRRHLPQQRPRRIAKLFWVLFVIFFPYLGVFVYLIARGHKMSEHALEEAKAQDAAARAYIRKPRRPASPGGELQKLADLGSGMIPTPSSRPEGEDPHLI